MQRIVALVTASVLVIPIECLAQETLFSNGRSFEHLVAAAYREVPASSATVKSEKRASQSPPPKSSWASRHPVWAGTLAGLVGGTAAGVAVTASTCPDSSEPALCYPMFMTTLPALGAGVGAIVGRAISR